MKKSKYFFFYQEHNQKIAEKTRLELTAISLSVILQTVQLLQLQSVYLDEIESQYISNQWKVSSIFC